jgi:hypothetical protein
VLFEKAVLQIRFAQDGTLEPTAGPVPRLAGYVLDRTRPAQTIFQAEL